MRTVTTTAAAALILAAAAAPAASDWPEYRGPGANSHSDATGLPLTWSETENVTWKVKIHGRGWSSPIVMDGRLWLTTATPDARKLYVVCVDAENGTILHDIKLYDVPRPQFIHRFNSAASPSPVGEEGRIYIEFGSEGTACLDAKTAKVIWSRRDINCNHFRGAGSSPLIWKNLLILTRDGSDRQYVTAVDKRTGKTVWTTRRTTDFQDLKNGKPIRDGDWRKSYATPIVIDVNGTPQLISPGSKAAFAYEPATGREIWTVKYHPNHSSASRTNFGNGLVYISTGYSRSRLFAVRPDGRGNVTRSHVAWRRTESVPKKPSALLIGERLFMVDDDGSGTCLNAVTGDPVWRARIGGKHSASPVHAEGRIYFFSEHGETLVIRAADTFQELARNRLGDGFMGSPAITGRAFILRTKTHLYRVEK